MDEPIRDCRAAAAVPPAADRSWQAVVPSCSNWSSVALGSALTPRDSSRTLSRYASEPAADGAAGLGAIVVGAGFLADPPLHPASPTGTAMNRPSAQIPPSRRMP